MPDRILHVLVMPEQFPRGPGDLAGVFSLDYITAIKPHCQVTVLMPGHEDRRGLTHVARDDDGVEYLEWTPWLHGGGDLRQRLGRLETLYQLGKVERDLPQVHLIHAHGAVFHGVPACTLAAKLGVPVVVTVHTGPFSKLLRRPTLRWLTRRTLERADCVCPVSNDLRRQIADAGIRPKRTEVTYNPVDTELFRPTKSMGAPYRRIAFAGRLEEYKGGMRVLRAFGEIIGRWPGWTLVIAGDGPERPALERFLQRHPAVAKSVQLLGPHTKRQLAELFATSDLFVYPSRHETFGLLLAEAMSAGLPVIGPNCTAPPEFIDNRHGLLVPPDDVPAIAAAMEHVLQKLPTYRPDNIRDAVVQRFGLEVFGRRLLGLYNDLYRLSEDDGAFPCAASQAS
jgi:glycosyltransferase involved in cell wall biosynthesis